MAQKLRKHGKKLQKTSVGCHIDFTILLSMLKVKVYRMLKNRLNEQEYHACELLYYMYFIDSLYYFISNIFNANITNTPNLSKQLLRKGERM